MLTEHFLQDLQCRPWGCVDIFWNSPLQRIFAKFATYFTPAEILQFCKYFDHMEAAKDVSALLHTKCKVDGLVHEPGQQFDSLHFNTCNQRISANSYYRKSSHKPSLPAFPSSENSCSSGIVYWSLCEEKRNKSK